MSDTKQAEEYRCNILRTVHSIESLAILKYIDTIVSDIAKEDIGATKAGTEKGRISELVTKIDNIWILDQIYRFIVNMTK